MKDKEQEHKVNTNEEIHNSEKTSKFNQNLASEKLQVNFDQNVLKTDWNELQPCCSKKEMRVLTSTEAKSESNQTLGGKKSNLDMYIIPSK